MTTKLISFDPIPAGGSWSVTIGNYSTGAMNGNGFSGGVPAAGMEDGTESIQGLLRKNIAKDLTVTGDYAAGFTLTFDPSLGTLSVGSGGLYTLGGVVDVARVRAGVAADSGVQAVHVVEMDGDSGASGEIGGVPVSAGYSAAAMQSAILGATGQGCVVLRQGTTYTITYSTAGPVSVPAVNQGSLMTLSISETTAGVYPYAGVTEIQTVTVPGDTTGGTWMLDGSTLAWDATAAAADAAVTSAQVSVAKSGFTYTVTWAAAGPRDLLMADGSMDLRRSVTVHVNDP